MKMAVLWDVAPCSLVETDRRLEMLTTSSSGPLRITLMMGAETSATLVYFHETSHCHITEGSYLRSTYLQNNKSTENLVRGNIF
jgi:hypothetical protein